MIIIFLLAAAAFSLPDIDTLSDNGMVQIPALHQSPVSGSDVKFAIDTAGYAYLFGGCTYGNLAGATHNNDVYRYDIRTGWCDKLYGCPNQTDVPANPCIMGCQAGTVYDPTRNCVWFGNGARNLGWDCYKNVTPVPVFNGDGIWRFDCPGGPSPSSATP